MPKHHWFRLIPVRSPLLRESLLFSFPPGNEMFQFPGFAFRLLGIPDRSGGLPHSDICGLTVICTSPQLNAAYHVLLRLKEPRHPPYALIYFLSPMDSSIAAVIRISPLRISFKTLFLPACQWTLSLLQNSVIWWGIEPRFFFSLQANLTKNEIIEIIEIILNQIKTFNP